MLVTPGSQRVKTVEKLKGNTKKPQRGMDGNWSRLKRIAFG